MKRLLILSSLFLVGCVGSHKASETVQPPAVTAPVEMAAEPVNIEKGDIVKVKIETTKGTIEVNLFAKEAPKTVENFVTLAKKGFYDGIIFHRVIPGFMI